MPMFYRQSPIKRSKKEEGFLPLWDLEYEVLPSRVVKVVGTKFRIRTAGKTISGYRFGRIPVREPSLRLRLATLPGTMVPVTGTATALAPFATSPIFTYFSSKALYLCTNHFSFYERRFEPYLLFSDTRS